MNENKKMILTLLIIIGFVLLIPILNYFSYREGEKMIDGVVNQMRSDEVNLIYIGRPTCGACLMLEPDLKDITKQYDISYTSVNVDKLNNKQYDELLEMFGFNDEDKKFATPYLVFVQKGEIIAEKTGYHAEEDELFIFLQDNGAIDETEVFKSKTPNLTRISLEEYNNIITSKTKEIVVIGQNGCSACDVAKPLLDEIVQEYNLKINYFTVNSISTEEEEEEFLNSLDYYSENTEWGTPLTLIVQNNKVLNDKDGFYDKEDYIDFFKDTGFISE